MKRTWAEVLICILALTLVLSGCGDGQLASGAPEETGGGTAAQTQAPTDELQAQPHTQEVETTQAPEQATQGVVVSETPQPSAPAAEPTLEIQEEESPSGGEENTIMKMNVEVNGVAFTATLERNGAVDALVAMLENGPMTIQMSDYAGFEKVGPLGTSLPTSNSQTTTHAGDIVLYQGNQIVMFYGSNSWNYTRLGKIDDLTGWAEALGSGNVTVTFSLAG